MARTRKLGRLPVGAALLMVVATAGACSSDSAAAALPACATKRPPVYDVQPTRDPSAPPSTYPVATAPPVPTASASDIGSALDALTHRIAGDSGLLARSGVFMSFWGPDTSTGTVFVTLMPGTCTRSVTLPTDMVIRAQGVFDGLYGPGRVIVRRVAMPGTTQD